ncbi:HAMP domain-containing sensor histidine kinase [Formosa sp. PL04]|uniref:sensor histidine kinase n=1 Tax=Formosa sp. PL04 TaxID=3081755 RepID=UPI002981406F|nr:HAMP domain-containing sensor histidine kinase [Formosa sp. PL04]MDW5289139.1 HAMP domain-containing sensor histidine kinase [Formosa sp. PL04]
MKLYSNLSKISLLKKYSTKFLAIAFLGIHIPLIGLIIFLTFNKNVLSTSVILIFTLIFTLGATAITLAILNKLLEPIKLASNTLKMYLESQQLPTLPTNFKDEVGVLLKDLQFSIEVFDNLIDSKQQTIAILSHDLRNPCSGILMSLDLLEDEESISEREIILKNIKSLAEDQLTLMESTLSNLRSETQTQGKLEKSELNLKEIITTVIASQTDALEEKNIDLVFNCTTELMINGNETAFRQIFINLISNAIKFSQKGGTIWINAIKTNSEINIDIIDQGLGFKKEVSEALFKPFTEHSRLGSKGESSQGMGLFIARRFVNKHFGKLTAKSEGTDQGATFSIHLPLN